MGEGRGGIDLDCVPITNEMGSVSRKANKQRLAESVLNGVPSQTRSILGHSV